jgi:hypothetical protein
VGPRTALLLLCFTFSLLHTLAQLVQTNCSVSLEIKNKSVLYKFLRDEYSQNLDA